jgi:hypothetical protein
MIHSASFPSDDSSMTPKHWVGTLAALACGVSLSLVIDGYSFGQSNHGVYLLDSLRLKDPTLLQRDWFTANTLQYHLLFTWLTYALRSVGLLATGFFVGYLILVMLLHVAWLGITKKLGGSVMTYLLSILIFYCLAGGLGLGMYKFLQDGSFLPSNVAAVTTFVGVWCFISKRLGPAAVATAVAGIAHLNYAVLGFLIWGLVAIFWVHRNQTWKALLTPRAITLASVALLPCGLNMLNATIAMWGQGAKLPLNEFVDLYARLRHPHHYDPFSWPTVIWVCYVLPFPVAIIAARLNWKNEHWRFATAGALMILGLQLLAFIGAGLLYVSDTLVQMSMWRFGVIAKALASIAVAWLVMDYLRVGPRVIAGLLILLAVGAASSSLIPFEGDTRRFVLQNQALFLSSSVTLLASASLLWRRSFVHALPAFAALALMIFAATDYQLGPRLVPEDEPGMVEVARWSKQNTPMDSLFVIPPQDSLFRLESHRAAVISFKQVPQLAGELPEWRRRLQRVLDMPDARALERPMYRTMVDIKLRYANLPASHFIAVAREFGAEYVVTARELPDAARGPLRLVFASSDQTYFLYAVQHQPPLP